MARISKRTLTRLEIVQEATKQFLEKGFTATTVSAISKALEMSPGNLTFHYPTKDHLLSELVDMLCDFQWKLMEEDANDGISSVMAICLELASMAGASEEEPVIKDFFISAYTSPMCLGIIRRNDAERAKKVFGEYCADWTDEQFAEAEILCSGIEYATLMTTDDTIPLETRISGALDNILRIFNVPVEVRKTKIQRVLAMDHRSLGKRALREFREYVEQANEEAFLNLLKR